MKHAESKSSMFASQLITRQIADLGDWRGELLERLRQLIHEALPGVVEEWKWDIAAWSQNGMLCSAGAFKDHVKLNFFQGAHLDDPRRLFNSGLDAKTSRAINFNQGDEINASALQALLRAAASYNALAGKKK